MESVGASAVASQGAGLAITTTLNEAPGVGIEAALAMIERVAASRSFTAVEKSLLEQLREWAPLRDLEAVHKALSAQKDALISRYVLFSVSDLKQRCTYKGSAVSYLFVVNCD
jgi:hypothetical protein